SDPRPRRACLCDRGRGGNQDRSDADLTDGAVGPPAPPRGRRSPGPASHCRLTPQQELKGERMKVSGEATLHHPVADVYAALTDPAILVRTIPGCQRLEQTGTDTYQATGAAGVASIKGLFDGNVRLADQVAPGSFTLHASGAVAPGTVSAVARVTLAEADGGTLLRYDADATIGGVIG